MIFMLFDEIVAWQAAVISLSSIHSFILSVRIGSSFIRTHRETYSHSKLKHTCSSPSVRSLFLSFYLTILTLSCGSLSLSDSLAECLSVVLFLSHLYAKYMLHNVPSYVHRQKLYKFERMTSTLTVCVCIYIANGIVFYFISFYTCVLCALYVWLNHKYNTKCHYSIELCCTALHYAAYNAMRYERRQANKLQSYLYIYDFTA